MKILLIEKNNYQVESLLFILEKKNCLVTYKNKLTRNISLTSLLCNHDICIVDSQVIDSYGIEEFFHNVKKVENVPVILTSNNNEPANIIQYLKRGCVDYIYKPFLYEELEIRIFKALNIVIEEKIFLNKNTYFDKRTNEIYCNNTKIEIRKKEFLLLKLFINNINKRLEYNYITDYVWEGEERENFPLRQLVSDLKKSLKLNNNIIKTIHGIGYVFKYDNKLSDKHLTNIH